MIVEIDGFFHQILITGKKCSKQELEQKYLIAKELIIDIREIPDIFYRLYKFKQIPYSNDIEVDFVIDTDTDRIYKPSYKK